MPDIYIFFLFILGAIFGSFANVLIIRLPVQESILTPSHCRRCKKRVSWSDNIPVLSYFILRGKCSQCGEKFSIKYACVEMLMASLFALAYWRIGMNWFLLEFLIFIFASVTAAFIDIDHFILPDVFTLGGSVVALVGAAINPEREFTQALIGFLVGGGFLYATAYLHFKLRNKEGMGGGDIKLLGWIGALMGWQSVLFVLIVSSFTSIGFALLRYLISKKGINEPLQFGPFLVAGALLFVFLGSPTMVQWFSSLYGLQSG